MYVSCIYSDISMFGLAYNQTNSRVSLYLVEGEEFMAATVHACVCRVVQWLILYTYSWLYDFVWLAEDVGMGACCHCNGMVYRASISVAANQK